MNTTPLPRRLTPRKLLEALKRLLESPEVSMTTRNLRREHGTTTYDREKVSGDLIDVKIVIDKRNAPIVSIVIHELLHVYMAKQHQIDCLFNDSLEEAVVASLTDVLENYLHDAKNERLFQAWVRAVEEKLK